MSKGNRTTGPRAGRPRLTKSERSVMTSMRLEKLKSTLMFAAELTIELARLAALNWSREQIARTLGVTPRSLYSWAKGVPPAPARAMQAGVSEMLRQLTKPPAPAPPKPPAPGTAP